MALADLWARVSESGHSAILEPGRAGWTMHLGTYTSKPGACESVVAAALDAMADTEPEKVGENTLFAIFNRRQAATNTRIWSRAEWDHRGDALRHALLSKPAATPSRLEAPRMAITAPPRVPRPKLVSPPPKIEDLRAHAPKTSKWGKLF